MVEIRGIVGEVVARLRAQFFSYFLNTVILRAQILPYFLKTAVAVRTVFTILLENRRSEAHSFHDTF